MLVDEVDESAYVEFIDSVVNNPRHAYQIFKLNPEIVKIMTMTQIRACYHLLRKGVGENEAKELKNTAIGVLEKCLEDSQTDEEFGDKSPKLFKYKDIDRL